MDLVMFCEPTIERALLRFPIATVNYALATTTNAPHLSHGLRVTLGRRKEGKPDWSLICGPANELPTKPANLLPGDTKVYHKWTPEHIQSSHDEWKKPISQVAGYMTEHKVRYGFIVTDVHAVVLRLVCIDAEKALITTRILRDLSDRSYEQQLENNNAFRTLRSASSSSAPSGKQGQRVRRLSQEDYEDDDPRAWEYSLEFASFPWDAEENQMSGKLALWALAMMATYGDSSLKRCYPGLDTWREEPDGFVHNTSGAKKSRRDKSFVIEELNDKPHRFGKMESYRRPRQTVPATPPQFASSSNTD